jgi:aspartyl-tRNA(Asn)/glutamyl-tRNA(Gln) amidotransferase subunit A
MDNNIPLALRKVKADFLGSSVLSANLFTMRRKTDLLIPRINEKNRVQSLVLIAILVDNRITIVLYDLWIITFSRFDARIIYQMKPDLSVLTLEKASKDLTCRHYSALDLAEACLDRIAQLNPVINAFITPTPELAIQAALQASAIFSNNPSNMDKLLLLGLPVGIKDMFDVAGVPTTAGTLSFKDQIPVDDAISVQRLKLSGAVILGKTNTHEIALGVTGVNPHYGPVKNPWDISRIAGGSSSGSAAAVASGMCLGAIGTDTGGSVRIPAALCGVVGLKPTYGRVSLRGVVPLSWNLDHVGTLTRSVRDAAILLSVLAGYDPHDPVSVDRPVGDYLGSIDCVVKGWRIALACGAFIEASNSEVLKDVNEAEQVFRDLGARVEKTDISWLEDLAVANGQMTQADAATFHRDRMNEHPEAFGNDVLQRLRRGASLSSGEYVLARRKQVEGRRRFETFFEKYDILLLPTTPTQAPHFEEINALDAASQLTRFTSSFNLMGLPAMSLPCGFTVSGLPVGLQIVSKHWDEARLLQAGYQFEQARGQEIRFPKF